MLYNYKMTNFISNKIRRTFHNLKNNCIFKEKSLLYFESTTPSGETVETNEVDLSWDIRSFNEGIEELGGEINRASNISDIIPLWDKTNVLLRAKKIKENNPLLYEKQEIQLKLRSLYYNLISLYDEEFERTLANPQDSQDSLEFYRNCFTFLINTTGFFTELDNDNKIYVFTDLFAPEEREEIQRGLRDEEIDGNVNVVIPEEREEIQRGLRDRLAQASAFFQEYLRENPNIIQEYLSSAEDFGRHIGVVSGESSEEFKDFHNEALNTYFEAIEVATLNTALENKFRIIKTNEGLQKIHIDFANNENQMETWEISSFYEEGIFIKSLNNPNKVKIFFHLREFLELLEQDNFAQVIEQMEADYENEKKYQDLLSDFDLPRDEPIHYISVFEETDCGVIKPTYFGSMFFSEQLRQSYPNLEIGSLVRELDPIQTLETQIQREYSQGKRNFFLDFYGHGDEDIGLMTFNPPITASVLTELINKFPDAKFVIHTFACEGAGFREGFLRIMQDNPELRDRISIFLQTKPRIPIVSFSTAERTASGNLSMAEMTLYQATLARALSEGRTFGQAVIEADRASKISGLNPESIIGGQLITKNIRSDLETNISIPS